jgi:transcriptional regulator with XRE-family HTH domain
MSVATLPQKEIRWSPRLIKRLRDDRTQAEFAELLGAAVEEVEHWESGQAAPNAKQMELLSGLAEKEHFLRDWKLADSGVLRTDLDEALSQHRKEIGQLLDYKAGKLQE